VSAHRPAEETNDPLIADHRNFYKVEKWIMHAPYPTTFEQMVVSDATAVAADGRVSLGGPAPDLHRAELFKDGRNPLAENALGRS
jgi:hypothetical protein